MDIAQNIIEEVSKKDIVQEVKKIPKVSVVPMIQKKIKKEKKEIKIKKPSFVKTKLFLEKYKEKINFIREFIFYSLIYGIIVNYMLWGVFGIGFSIFRFPAFGILVYLIKEEGVIFLRKVFKK